MGDEQVPSEALRPPVLEQHRRDEEDRDGQQVVVHHGVPVLEAGELDALAHREEIGRRREAVLSMREGEESRRRRNEASESDLKRGNERKRDER